MMARTLVLAALFALALGCEAADKAGPTPAPDPPKTDAPKPRESTKTAFNQNKTLFLEKFKDGRMRVLVECEVCLREGPLELLMCRKQTKEHESIQRPLAQADRSEEHTSELQS